jgi:Flp pilus assembly protein TadG
VKRPLRPRRLRGEEGIATTEAVLVTPVLLLLVMTVFQFGLWYHAQHVATAAAEEGARTARAEQGTATAGRARAEAFLDQAGPTIVQDRTVDAARTADTVTVTVHGTAVAVIPGLHLSISATATSPVERFDPDTDQP